MHAGRTIAAMSDVDGRIDPEAYEDEGQPKQKRWDFSWNRWGNRLAYSLIAGIVINVTTGIYFLGTVITVVLFVLTSAIVEVVRRR